MVYFFIFILFWIFLLANSEDPDQSPSSDLGLHCLPIPKNWDARLIWVKCSSAKKKKEYHNADKSLIWIRAYRFYLKIYNLAKKIDIPLPTYTDEPDNNTASNEKGNNSLEIIIKVEFYINAPIICNHGFVNCS